MQPNLHMQPVVQSVLQPEQPVLQPDEEPVASCKQAFNLMNVCLRDAVGCYISRES